MKHYFFALLALCLICSCSAQRSVYKKADLIKNKQHFIAVLPLKNLTDYPNAGRIVSNMLTIELYKKKNFTILEHTAMLKKLNLDDDFSENTQSNVEAYEIGKKLGVDAIIYGAVTEYRYKRELNLVPVVSIHVRMFDIKEKRVIWATSYSTNGRCTMFCKNSLSALAQTVCKRVSRSI